MVQSVIVVGAGIIGAATAFQLSKAGYSVRIVHAGPPDATDAAFGWINASFFLDQDHHHLRSAGIAAWHRILAEVPLGVNWQGCLCWDMQPAQMEATFAQLKALDYPVEILEGPQLRAMEPALQVVPDQALFFPSEGAAASNEIAQQLLTAAQSLGAQRISNVHVTSLKSANGRVVGVETPQGDLLADQVIVAAGTGTAALAKSIGSQVPLAPRPAYILRTNPQEKLLNHILATPHGEIRQEPSGQILMPVSVGHQGDTTKALTQSPSDAADSAMGRLRDMFGTMEQADWSQVIRAERPVPLDGLPAIGPIAEGAYVAVLHSGITLGPIVAELVCKDINGRLDNTDTAMLAPYRPDRFVVA